MSNLNNIQIERYSRQLILKDWSTDFQVFLLSRRILVPDTLPSCGLYLASAGVGEITLYGDNGQDWLPNHLASLNSDIKVTTEPTDTYHCLIGAAEQLSSHRHLLDKTSSAEIFLNFNDKEPSVVLKSSTPPLQLRSPISGSTHAIQQLLAGTLAASMALHWLKA